MTDDRIAPERQIWICGACGKTSKDQYGDPGTSWDESCMLNSVLVWESSVKRTNGGVAAIQVTDPEPPP